MRGNPGLITSPTWHHDALCSGATGLFYDEHPDAVRQAVATCRECPVLDQCVADTFENEPWGINRLGVRAR